MNPNVQDPFSSQAFKTAVVTEGGTYLSPGIYNDIEVKALKLVQSRNAQTLGAMMFIAELKVHESNTPTTPNGTDASWVANFSKINGPGNVKNFMAKCLGVNLDAITDDVARGLVSATNPCAGTRLKAVATNVPTKNGGQFTKITWSLVKRSAMVEEMLGG